MSHEGLHEPAELLGDATKNLHRALISLIEELEAIDWYQQRADACTDPALKAVLLHNRNEEVEHGMMTLEWLRRNDATFDKFSRRYLFKDEDIIAIEKAAEAAEQAREGDRVGERGVSPREPVAGGSEPFQGSDRSDGSLAIRSLRVP
jgi:ferritin-like protein